MSCLTIEQKARLIIQSGIHVYIPDCMISLASFVLDFHSLLIRSFIRIPSPSFL